jgi:hypothetical protein
MSEANIKYLKHALISILVGALVAFIASLLQGLLSLVKINGVDFVGTGAGMVYYLKSSKLA